MKKFSLFSKFLSIGLVVVLGLVCIPFRAHAESTYYSGLTDEELAEIFQLKVSDIQDPWQWISEAKTFVIVEDNGSNVTYWWNAPNIQMSAFNSLYSMIQLSGYGSGIGQPAKEKEWLVKLPEASQAKTAMEKYGFDLQNPAYMGERPLITISILGVILPDSTGNFFTRLLDLIFDGDIVELPTDEDLNSLVYVAPRDYETGGVTFQKWVEENWYEIMHDGDGDDPYIEPGQVLLTMANSDGMYQGACWVRDTIIDQNGLAESTDAAFICQQLSEICGPYYTDVAKNIIASSGIDKTHSTERIMPYDLGRMNAEDASKFDNIKDPRSEMQENLLSTGYLNILTNMFKSSILSVSSKLSEFSVALNRLCNFSFLEDIGLDPTIIWTNSIFSFLILIAMVFFLFYAIKSAIAVLKGSGSKYVLVFKVLGIFVVTLCVYAVGTNPDGTYQFIKNTSTSIWGISNVTMEQTRSLDALYGDGDTAARSDCQLWLPYFDVWTSYHTNHGILDSEQLIDMSTVQPEENGLVAPKIGSKTQNLWSTILADEFTQEKYYDGKIYRVVDHFMAPRINDLQLSDGNATWNVTVNENYNGNIQTSVNFGAVPFQVLILLLVFVKAVLFFEFVLNIALLFVNLTLSVTNSRDLGNVLKELGASCLNVMFVGLAVTMAVWTSLVTRGIPAVIVAIFYFFLFFQGLKALIQSNSVFKPKVLRFAQKQARKVKAMFSDGGIA